MKKYAFTLLTIAIMLVSCSKNNDPEPELPKVTIITCLKNGSLAEGFAMITILYTPEKQVARITYNDRSVDEFRYQGNEVYVLNTLSGESNTTYTLSNNLISAYEIKKENPATNLLYTYDKFNYEYSMGDLRRVKMSGNRIKNNDLEAYQSKVDHEFEWKNRNLVKYNAGNNILEFTYTDKPHPRNYPFRILNTLGLENGDLRDTFIQQENFSPMNLLLGNCSNNLVETAKWYRNPEINQILGEYDFDYTLDSNGYVSKVIITESTNDRQPDNQYVVTFVYSDI